MISSLLWGRAKIRLTRPSTCLNRTLPQLLASLPLTSAGPLLHLLRPNQLRFKSYSKKPTSKRGHRDGPGRPSSSHKPVKAAKTNEGPTTVKAAKAVENPTSVKVSKPVKTQKKVQGGKPVKDPKPVEGASLVKAAKLAETPRTVQGPKSVKSPEKVNRAGKEVKAPKPVKNPKLVKPPNPAKDLKSVKASKLVKPDRLANKSSTPNDPAHIRRAGEDVRNGSPRIGSQPTPKLNGVNQASPVKLRKLHGTRRAEAWAKTKESKTKAVTSKEALSKAESLDFDSILRDVHSAKKPPQPEVAPMDQSLATEKSVNALMTRPWSEKDDIQDIKKRIKTLPKAARVIAMKKFMKEQKANKRLASTKAGKERALARRLNKPVAVRQVQSTRRIDVNGYRRLPKMDIARKRQGTKSDMHIGEQETSAKLSVPSQPADANSDRSGNVTVEAMKASRNSHDSADHGNWRAHAPRGETRDRTSKELGSHFNAADFEKALTQEDTRYTRFQANRENRNRASVQIQRFAAPMALDPLPMGLGPFSIRNRRGIDADRPSFPSLERSSKLAPQIKADEMTTPATPLSPEASILDVNLPQIEASELITPTMPLSSEVSILAVDSPEVPVLQDHERQNIASTAYEPLSQMEANESGAPSPDSLVSQDQDSQTILEDNNSLSQVEIGGIDAPPKPPSPSEKQNPELAVKDDHGASQITIASDSLDAPPLIPMGALDQAPQPVLNDTEVLSQVKISGLDAQPKTRSPSETRSPEIGAKNGQGTSQVTSDSPDALPKISSAVSSHDSEPVMTKTEASPQLEVHDPDALPKSLPLDTQNPGPAEKNGPGESQATSDSLDGPSKAPSPAKGQNHNVDPQNVSKMARVPAMQENLSQEKVDDGDILRHPLSTFTEQDPEPTLKGDQTALQSTPKDLDAPPENLFPSRSKHHNQNKSWKAAPFLPESSPPDEADEGAAPPKASPAPVQQQEPRKTASTSEDNLPQVKHDDVDRETPENALHAPGGALQLQKDVSNVYVPRESHRKFIVDRLEGLQPRPIAEKNVRVLGASNKEQIQLNESKPLQYERKTKIAKRKKPVEWHMY